MAELRLMYLFFLDNDVLDVGKNSYAHVWGCARLQEVFPKRQAQSNTKSVFA